MAGLVGLVSDIIQNWTMGSPGPGGGVTVARGQMGAWPGSRVKGCWPRPGNSGSLDTLFRAELLCITNVGGGAGTRNTNVAI